jgi:hypothetical protein
MCNIMALGYDKKLDPARSYIKISHAWFILEAPSPRLQNLPVNTFRSDRVDTSITRCNSNYKICCSRETGGGGAMQLI